MFDQYGFFASVAKTEDVLLVEVDGLAFRISMPTEIVDQLHP